MARRGWALGILAFTGLAGLIGAACGVAGSSSSAAGPVAARPAPQFAPAAGAPAEGATGSAGAPVADLALPLVQAKIVKVAQITLRLAKGSFARQFQQPSQIAARHGGYVATSETSKGILPSGTVVLRVPADQFEAALSELKALGTLTFETISGQDVTGQFVDLQARLRNWEAQETVLLRLMAKSTTIDDSLKVQRQLQDVQLSIEEIQGQVHALSDQADLSTITLSMAEGGTVLANLKSASTLARAWRQALRGSIAVLASVVVGLGYLVPLALLALVLFVAWRVGLHRARSRVAVTARS